MTLSLLLICWVLAAVVSAQGQGDTPAPLVSPDIDSDGTVTLRLRAPMAEGVNLVSGGDIPGVPFGGGLPLESDADGVWSVTLDLDSGGYRYNFNVDGVATLDPSNPGISQSNGNAWSLFYVPGSEFMDTREVPHGAVAEVHYPSEVLGRTRRMHVYTPPGYERNDESYPVFYLLHGAGDSDDSWSTVGRAGFILDNLIASGEAEPMIVVMPAGHTRRFGGGGLAQEDFTAEFASDIKPYVEAKYRVRLGRADTALAGLSMGGAQTLDIAMNDLVDYAYLGVFSSGVFGIQDDASWQQRHSAALNDPALRRGLELVWFSTGNEDFLIETTELTVDMLRDAGFDVTYEESSGGHTWINWREYLNEFAPMLFK